MLLYHLTQLPKAVCGDQALTYVRDVEKEERKETTNPRARPVE